MTFDLFWSKYPRKVSKGRARKAWLKLTPEQIEKVLGVIDEHLQYWRAAGTEMQWIPYPASWLNDERYEDELVMPKPREKTLAERRAENMDIICGRVKRAEPIEGFSTRVDTDPFRQIPAYLRVVGGEDVGQR